MHHFLNLQRTLVFKCILVDVVTDLQGGSIKAPSCVYVCVCVCVCVCEENHPSAALAKEQVAALAGYHIDIAGNFF